MNKEQKTMDAPLDPEMVILHLLLHDQSGWDLVIQKQPSSSVELIHADSNISVVWWPERDEYTPAADSGPFHVKMEKTGEKDPEEALFFLLGTSLPISSSVLTDAVSVFIQQHMLDEHLKKNEYLYQKISKALRSDDIQ